jgi:ribosomal protein S18 acetylase RimI-like enzyme
MGGEHGPTQVIPVTGERVAEAVEALAPAFLADPLMRYLMPGLSSPADERLREFFRFACHTYLALGWQVLGVAPGQRLVAVLGLMPPGRPSFPAAVQEWYDRLKAALGAEGARRMDAFNRLTAERRPAESHFDVTFVGVHPQAQGRGSARLLLESAHAASEAHPTSTGVALDTENPANVAFYEHLGYRVTAQDRVGDVQVWSMFRPNGTGGG